MKQDPIRKRGERRAKTLYQGWLTMIYQSRETKLIAGAAPHEA